MKTDDLIREEKSREGFTSTNIYLNTKFEDLTENQKKYIRSVANYLLIIVENISSAAIRIEEAEEELDWQKVRDYQVAVLDRLFALKKFIEANLRIDSLSERPKNVPPKDLETQQILCRLDKIESALWDLAYMDQKLVCEKLSFIEDMNELKNKNAETIKTLKDKVW